MLTSGVPGVDTNGDGTPDTFPVPAANVPPQFTPLPPGAGTITFNQGNVAFTLPGRPQPGNSGFAPGFALSLSHLFQPGQLVINAPSPGGGGNVGRVKIAENNSPLPRDRVFHNFSYFDNVPLIESGVNVNRFIPGFEKTFFGGIASVEMRFPFASTLNSDIVAGGIPDDDNLEFGNIGIPLKVLIYQNPNVAFSTGLQVSLPTADDTRGPASRRHAAGADRERIGPPDAVRRLAADAERPPLHARLRAGRYRHGRQRRSRSRTLPAAWFPPAAWTM